MSASTESHVQLPARRAAETCASHGLQHWCLQAGGGTERGGCTAGRWFAARIGRVKEITFGTFAEVVMRHDLRTSAAAALIALLNGSLERIVVLMLGRSSSESQVRT